MKRALAACVCVLAGCSSTPPPPDWQVNAQQAVEAGIEASLAGDSASEARQFERALAEASRTGSPQRLAQVALMRCAAQAAGLAVGPCQDFEPWRADAGEAQRAYADYLRGEPLQPAQLQLLPEAQRTVAAATTPESAHAAVGGIADPLSRLVAAAVLLQQGRAGPQTISLAVDTASAQGWRRPLLAWLGVQLSRAEAAADTDAAARLRRRIAIVEGKGQGGR